MKQIFVSSTFKDMHIERDMIQTSLSPDLNDYAYKNRLEGLKFQDLRWGIDTEGEDEEDKDMKIVEVCLDEIQNNRPYFCVLLGDRYGWIPENDLVKKAGALYGIYDEDEEVHKSITHLEIDYGFLRNPKFVQNSFAYIRNIVGDVSGSIYESNDYEKQKIEELKAEIRRVLPPENIHEYTVEYKDGTLHGVEKFIELAKEDLLRALSNNREDEDLTENQKEINYHKSHAKELSVSSKARSKFEDQILKDIANDNVIAVKSESGYGKSTLMSNLYEKVDKSYNSLILFSGLTPKTTTAFGIMNIITEYIKQTLSEGQKTFTDAQMDEAIAIFNLEQKTLANVNKTVAGITKEEKLYEEALRDYFIKGKDELIIFIDAIDQLDNPESIEDLLKPIDFTANSKVKFIISYLEEDINQDNFLFLTNHANLRLPDLSYEDKFEVIESSLSTNDKGLNTDVRKAIAAKPGSRSPLYIDLLVRRLVMMNKIDFQNIIDAGDGYDVITNYQKELIKSMADDLEGLILEMIKQATTNLDIDPKSIGLTFAYIGVSKNGLREADLVEIFRIQGIDYKPLDFVLIKRYLRSFFLEDSLLRVDFTHKIIRKAILASMTDEQNKAFHQAISMAYMKLPMTDPVKLIDQYYSAYKAKDIGAALDLLENIGIHKDEIYGEDIEKAVAAITKIHNLSLKHIDDEWISDIFKAYENFDIDVQKTLLSYFVYGSYEEKTKESIKAANYNQELLLSYLTDLIQKYPDDLEILQLYGDHLSYLGVKYTLGSRSQAIRAEAYINKALEINQKIYEEIPSKNNKEKLATSLSNIGKFYLDKQNNDLDKSESYYLKSVLLFEELARDDKNLHNLENLALAYNNIANFYATGEARKYEMSKVFYEKSIDVLDRLLEKNRSVDLKKTRAMSQINLASLYLTDDNIDMARVNFELAVNTLKDVEALEPSLENKETLARVYNAIADVFASDLLKDESKAIDYYNMAIDLYMIILSHKELVSTKKNLATSYENLADLYADTDQKTAYDYYKKAIVLLEELISIDSSREDYRNLASSYNNLAFAYVDQRINLDEAEKYYLRSVELLDDIEDEDVNIEIEYDMALAYTNIGDLYYIKSEIDKADEYYEKAIGLHQKHIADRGEETSIEELLIIYSNMAVAKLDLGFDLESIEKDYLKVIDLIKIIDDPYKKLKKTAISYTNLANLYLIKANNFILAEECYLKSAELSKEVINIHRSAENIERLAVTYHNLAELYSLLDKDDYANKYNELAKKLGDEAGYKLEDNLNKFIHIHDFS